MRSEPRTVHRALLREVSDRLSSYGSDAALARRQHRSYAAALHEAGVEITMLPADPALADCCFIEDTAVLDGKRALITRMGFEPRRREVDATRAALADEFEIVEMEAPATLDGGDVLRVDDTVYVGVGRRTNAAGFAAVQEFLGRQCVKVRVHDCLHLKTGCTQVAPGTVTLNPDWVEPLAGLEIVETFDPNVVVVNGACLVSSPGLERTLQARGLEAHYLDISEFRKADGGLTCLSLLL